MKTIEVVISARGETTVQTKGFAGAECQLASKWIETAIGTKVSEQKTAEFYVPTMSQQNEVKA